MNIMKFAKEEILSIIMIAIILFTNLAITNSKHLIAVCLMFTITLIYTAFLIIKKPEIIKKMFKSYYFLWIILFFIEMFLYGFFGENTKEYSLKFHLLNFGWIIMTLIILQYHSEKVADVMAKASSIAIVMITLYILCTNFSGLIAVFNGEEVLIGRYLRTAVGNQNTTAISYIFLLIPVFYKIGIEKEKKYISIAIIGTIFMLLTASKKSIVALFVTLCIIGIGKSRNKKELLKNISKVLLAILVMAALCYCVPILHTIIWERIESMVSSIINFNTTDQSSTTLRLNFILTAFTKAWDKPIFGHGWGAFAPMYGYSSLYNANLYTHNNYAEILFSFGLLGFFLYYWFPYRMVVKTIKNKNILCYIYIVNTLLIEFGTVWCYSSILGFLGFSIVSLLLEEQEENKILDTILCKFRKRKED